ncbi:segregation and condensation protein B [Micromonospora purpureochromogenes]|uniref:Segregation and condensation protein B n=1 Tax=Micromonospora purpureochromogenes TaxID=47872 RepID=A0A1C4ZAH8_9ACTN|nr:SMC-Scp complex subunit ScpB [Micromonospora purpureochromogenes]SCF29731.1 segregation and condensation protein B [Micromonospora purpureochromogenes]
MSDEERRDSLADQAAAWVPPWERPTPPRPTPPAEPSEPSDEPAAPTAVADDDGTRSPGKPDLPEPHGEENAATSGAEPTGQSHPAEETASTADPAPTGGTDEPAGEGAAARVPGKQPGPRRRATPAPEPAPVLDDAELRGALEAILLVVDEPVSELTLAQVLEQPAERVGPMLDEIAAGYTAAGHGFELRRAAGGWRLYTRPEYATYVERFVLDGQSVRLTQAALETLAVIAYKQPVTRSRISAIRGVNCDGVIRTLVSRGLVEECGTEPDSGAFLYRTTTMFLEKLGLNSVDDLPPLAPFLPDDVEELADATR